MTSTSSSIAHSTRFATNPSAMVFPAIVLGFALMAQAQENIPYMNNIMGTLSDPRVIEQLELVGQQQEIIKELQKEFGEMRYRLDREMRQRVEESPPEDKQRLKQEYQKRSEKERLRIVAQIKNELVPHQVERLEQLTAQRRLREDPRAAGLLSQQMIEYLQIDARQEDRIREKGDEIRSRVTKQIQEILNEAKQDLLEELTAEQKDRYQKLVGDPLPIGRPKQDSKVKDKKGRELKRPK